MLGLVLVATTAHTTIYLTMISLKDSTADGWWLIVKCRYFHCCHYSNAFFPSLIHFYFYSFFFQLNHVTPCAMCSDQPLLLLPSVNRASLSCACATTNIGTRCSLHRATTASLLLYFGRRYNDYHHLLSSCCYYYCWYCCCCLTSNVCSRNGTHLRVAQSNSSNYMNDQGVSKSNQNKSRQTWMECSRVSGRQYKINTHQLN